MAEFKDLLIQLWTPARREGGKGRYGTGYPIGKDRILTARHNLVGKDVDQRAPFKIRWYKLPEGSPARKWCSVERESIVWEDVGLDAALIAYRFPAEVCDWRGLSPREPRGNESWESEGFPDHGVLDDPKQRESVTFDGGWHTPASGDQQASLRVNGGVDLEQGWRGASGSPVFAGEEIIAMLNEWRPHFKGTKLKAVRASKLLQQDGLRKKLGYPLVSSPTAALLDRLDQTRIGAVRALARELIKGDFPATDADTKQRLAEELTNSDSASLLDSAFAALQPVPGKPSDPDDRASLCVLIRNILPLLHEPDTVARMQQLLLGSSSLLLGFPVTIEIVAEVLMAATDGREIDRAGAGEHGACALNESLTGVDVGFDYDGSAQARAVEAHLMRRYSLCEHTFSASFVAALFTKIPQAEKDRFRNWYQTAKAEVAGQLRFEATKLKRRTYFTFDLPDDSEARDNTLNTLRRLKRDFDAIAFLELVKHDDDHLYLEQKEVFRVLPTILAADGPSR